MRIGITPSCQDGPPVLKLRRPIHFTGRASAWTVSTKSPILSSSMRISPLGVRIEVPRRKHGALLPGLLLLGLPLLPGLLLLGLPAVAEDVRALQATALVVATRALAAAARP